jgi:hypothetical protein
MIFITNDTTMTNINSFLQTYGTVYSVGFSGLHFDGSRISFVRQMPMFDTQTIGKDQFFYSFCSCRRLREYFLYFYSYLFPLRIAKA